MYQIPHVFILSATMTRQNKMWTGYGEHCILDMVMDLNKLADECTAKMRVNQKME